MMEGTMDVKKYIPVGIDNAVECSIMLNGQGLTGMAWRESDEATELMLSSNTVMDTRLWVIGIDQIVGLSVLQADQPART
jgi:hypothetical protein